MNHKYKTSMFDEITIWVRGAGELGSATAHILHNVGFHVFLSELPLPLAIRRTVTFSDAVFLGETEVEGTKAVYYDINSIPEKTPPDHIPIQVDSPENILRLQPNILVDARMIKQYRENMMDYAPFVIGLGPGFEVGENCHVVIETMRGHDLGRIIWNGAALPNTKVPGEVGGETVRRVIYAPAEGTLEWQVDFGEIVSENDLMGTINKKYEIRAPFRGIVRGLISPQVLMRKGLKIADVDPRGEVVDYKSISDKSRSIGRGVLEAILIHLRKDTP
ncbi:MAG: EF2563 family selenium-dependent molybdenum hydroxylase system protein [Candidatus Marinimicrobia bacterium]|nr:EF2563 family selenium-dependent molybdenum hydroxylase system protein [Candidatus Neomarinimicrobiota bacterium]